MEIIEAVTSDIPELRRFYDRMCEVLGKQSFLPEGNKGGFPSDDMLHNAVKDHQQFIGSQDGNIAAAYVMNHECDAAYDQARWHVNAGRDKVGILHGLRVLLEYGGRGYSHKLVEHAIRIARVRGLKAIRLDCIVGDDIPQKMYMSLGFQYIDTVSITYVDIGVPRDFNLYELAL